MSRERNISVTARTAHPNRRSVVPRILRTFIGVYEEQICAARSAPATFRERPRCTKT